MAKPTYSIGGLDFETVQKVNAFLSGGAALAASIVPSATPAFPGANPPPAPPPVAAPPPPVGVPGVPVAAAPAAPPPPAPVAAPPVVAAPPPPAAVAGPRTPSLAVSELAARKGAKVAMDLVVQWTTAGWPEGDPKRGSKKFADIHPAHAEQFVAAADALANG